MKKFILFLVAALLTMPAVAATNPSVDDGKSTSISITKTKTKLDRDIFPDVQATLRQSQRVIELQMFEIGVAQVYIVDSFGRVVFEDTVDGDNNFAFVEAPQSKGVYTLVIWSPYFYGEGTFTIGQ